MSLYLVIMNYISSAILLFFFQCVSSPAFTKLGNNVYQSNGSQSDTQAAINASKASGTVIIPNGSYTWFLGLTIEKPISLSGQSKGGVTITNNVVEKDLLTVAVPGALWGRISNLNFIQGSGSGKHLAVNTPILLHDCYFETNGRVPRSILWATNGGVIWNCRFYSNQVDNSGIGFKAPSLDSSWTTNPTIGTADVKGTANTYVEDCTFKDLFLQAVDFDDNSRTVVRHCTFDNSAIASHGEETSPAGARHWEVYDNTFTFTASGGNYPLNLNYFFFIRGGTGVIANNVIPHIGSERWGEKSEITMTVFNIRRSSQFVPCQTSYPAARQLGQSYKNGAIVTDPIYLWGSTGAGNYNNPALIDYQPDQCGNGQKCANYIKRGRDYITGSPKPAYTEYPYPHPLRGTLSSSVSPRSSTSPGATSGSRKQAHPHPSVNP